MPDQKNMTDGSYARGKAVGRVGANLMAGGRVDSADVLRGLTMMLMVFFNDLSPAAPAWIHHIKPSSADGMNLADIVF
jgi:predicted acyltransferase